MICIVILCCTIFNFSAQDGQASSGTSSKVASFLIDTFANGEKMSPQEKIIFLQETEKMSNAFEKIPSIIWEDEYSKYRDVMDTYRDIKVDRWKDSSAK